MRRLSFSLLFLLLAAPFAAAQDWSGFINPSRAIDWTSAGFTIPSYSANCNIQPSLTTGSGAAAANATAIQNALASCDATHNVVNIPAGTWYVAGITYPSHGKQVLRGAGPTSTKLISTSEAGCAGLNAGICMISGSPAYNGSGQVLPSSGSQQCLWTGGLTQGSTSLTFSNCGGAPPNGQLILLDQANDTAMTGGVYECDELTSASCNYDGSGGSIGRRISGSDHSQIQVVKTTGVTSLGGGSYTVTISPGVYFTNVRAGNAAGAWWSDKTTLNGLENLTVDATADPDYAVSLYDCYQCWVSGVTFLNGGRANILLRQSANDVIQNNYFYQAQGHASQSYNIESVMTSANLIVNNIMHQTANPIMFNGGTGTVVAYNFSVNTIAFPNFLTPAFSSHSAGNVFILWEGNNFSGIQSDDAWGGSNQQTLFRNMLAGWQNSRTQGTTPLQLRTYSRIYNIVGNVLGQPGYHTGYECKATGNTTTSCAAGEDLSIYNLGTAFTGGTCGTGTPQSSPYCDAITATSSMRWGNYDTVNAAVRWDATEASPGVFTYVSANFSSGYFGSLAHTLPASLYYSSKPVWWPTDKAWPPVGPDVTNGNLGTCSGTYSGAQATSSSQCTGGTLTSQWASHATSIPAQDAFYAAGGKPDGTGSALQIDIGAYLAGNQGTTTYYTLSTATSGTGTGNVTGCSGLHTAGESFSCAVAPTNGSTLTSVSGCGSSSTTSPLTGTMPASDCTVSAIFAAGTPSVTPCYNGRGKIKHGGAPVLVGCRQ